MIFTDNSKVNLSALNRISELETMLGRSILLRARDYLEAQRMSLYRSYSVEENWYLFDGIEYITDHLLAHFRK